MQSKDALYAFLENTVSGSAQSDPLYDSSIFNTLRGSVNEAKRVVRVEVFDGQMILSGDPERQEENVRFEFQCWVTPEKDKDIESLDTATDLSYAMARQLFEALHADQTLGGVVCHADAGEFERGTGNLGAVNRGVTYLYGTINPKGEG